jgi:hypothetical protein
MNLLFRTLKNLDGISICLYENESLLKIWNKLTKEIICSVNYKVHNYESHITNNYDDIFRILRWFNFKDINSKNNNSNTCNPLGCENCSGCQYSSLTRLFNARRLLRECLPQDIIDSYIFIGESQVRDLIIYPTAFKKYIYLKNNELYAACFDYSEQPADWKISILTGYNNSQYYIDEFIPEILTIPTFIKQVYGIYNRNAGMWKLNIINERHCWQFENL